MHTVNIPCDSSINPAHIDKTRVRKIKFGDNLSTEVEPKNICYDPHTPNDKHLGNDSMNTLKKELQKCLLSKGFFLFHDIFISSFVQKIMKKKKLNVELL